MVQESSREVAETEAGGARSYAEAAAGASAQRRRRHRGNGDGERPFEPEQARATKACTGHGQFRSRGSVVGATRRDESRILPSAVDEPREEEKEIEVENDGKRPGAFALLSTSGHVYT